MNNDMMAEESKKDPSTVTQLQKEARHLRADLDKAISQEETLLNYLDLLNGDAWAAVRHSRSDPPLYLYLRKESHFHHADLKWKRTRIVKHDNEVTGSDLSTMSVNGSKQDLRKFP